jgi:hypothetical protein
LLLETAGPFVAEGNFNDDQLPRPLLHGAYAITALRPAAAVPLRLFVHRQGYLIVQAANGQIQDYKLTYIPDQLLLRDEAGRISRLHYLATPAGLRLTGTLGPDSVRWLAQPLPWRQLPLLRGW